MAASASLALGGAIARGIWRLADLHRLRSTRRQMGTEVAVTVHHADIGEARRLAEAAFEEMERLEAILSRHRRGTAVDRLNREGQLVDPPAELTELLAEARRYSELTGGAFDVTIAPLLRLYESYAAEGRLPAEAEIEAIRPLVDYRKLRIEGRGVRLIEPGMAVTLDAIAKGFIADRASRILVGGGAEHAMVEAGGDVASVGGSAGVGPWRIGIEDPRAAGSVLGVLQLRDEGVATSGDYRAAFTGDLARHHILDPRTGRSPSHTSAVTVVAPTASEADALSTAVFLLGAGAGLALLDRREGCEGLVVGKDGTSSESEGFGSYLA